MSSIKQGLPRRKIAIRNHRMQKKYWPFIFWPILILVIIGFIFWLQIKYLTFTDFVITYHPVDKSFYLTNSEEIKQQISALSQKRFLFFFHQNTPLTLWSSKIIKSLSVDLRLTKIQVFWRPPHQLEIRLTEDQPVAILSVAGDKDYYLNSQAQIISPIFRPVVDKNNVPIVWPVILDKTTTIYNLGQSVDILNMGLQIFDAFDGIKHPLKIKHLTITQNGGYYLGEAQTEPGYRVHFLLEKKEIVLEILRLKTLLNEKLKDIIPSSYIDLRFGEKVFYK